MKTNLRATLAGVILSIGSPAFSQNDVDEGEMYHLPAPLEGINEANVMWSKKIWRIIDLREKINHPLFFPTEETEDRKSLFKVISDELLNEPTITAYDPGPLLNNDRFDKPLSRKKLLGILIVEDTVWIEDLNGGPGKQEVVSFPVNPFDVKLLKVKEEWFFDKKRGVMDVRIIGIAPMKELKNPENGDIRGYAEMFWLYYPECRNLFAQFESFNRQNDKERISYDDVFVKRFFNSVIIKESNVYDRNINQYKKGMQQLYEAQELKQKQIELEHDLWEY